MPVNKIEIICKICGEVFIVSPSLATTKYCSRKCYFADVKKLGLRLGERHPMWDGMRNICKNCGKEFHVFHSQAARIKYCCRECHSAAHTIEKICNRCGKEFRVSLSKGNSKYCSKECYDSFRLGENNPMYNRIDRTCKHCGKKFKIKPSAIKRGHGIYCSKACHNASMYSQIERICKCCGKKFKEKPYNVKRGNGIYCCKECKDTYMHGEFSARWRGGKFPYYGGNWGKNGRRKKALEKSGFISEISKENNKLEVHHIISLRAFVNKYIDLCLKPYIPEIKNCSCFKILPYDMIPSMLFDEVNNLDNLVVLTSLEHHFYGEMPVGFFMAIRENMIDD